MSGVTKHIFDQEVRDILSMWDCEIKTIQPLLPKEYSKSDIIALLKEFYPYDAVNESSSLQIKYEVDKILRSFISLSKYDLISCAKEWRANKKSFQSALDYIYLSKDIIIKQDVLIS